MELHSDMERLILEKGFNELTEAERERVLALMDHLTYEQYRQVLTATRDIRNQTPPAPARLQQDLLSAFDANFKAPSPSSTWEKCRQHRIPTWQAAAASILLCLFSSFLLLRSVPHKEAIIERVHHIDTIYIERPQLVETPEVIGPMENVDSPSDKTSPTSRESKRSIAAHQPVDAPPIAQTPRADTSEKEDAAQSRTIAQDPNLLDLVTKVY